MASFLSPNPRHTTKVGDCQELVPQLLVQIVCSDWLRQRPHIVCMNMREPLASVGLVDIEPKQK